MEHLFTRIIKRVLIDEFGDKADSIYSSCPILQYINIKTRSASRGSKARGSFGNLYAIYVLVENYIEEGFHKNKGYRDYEGAKFSDLFQRQRELPFGQKLQNHALNHKLNQEFRKHFFALGYVPIIRDAETNRYWFNEHLLICDIDGQEHNIATSIIRIIDEYAEAKQDAFETFITACERIKNLQETEQDEATDFVVGLLAPNMDARLFEIVSYCILKYYYHNQTVFFGFELDSIEEGNLRLYKTGRTNANDGGIDFVMKPLGRFFQVTETTDVRKYFLDIDKIERYPITFVIKSDADTEDLEARIRKKANEQYPVTTIVQKYMDCIEELISLPILIQRFRECVEEGYLSNILNEIIRQSKVEFNYEL